MNVAAYASPVRRAFARAEGAVLAAAALAPLVWPTPFAVALGVGAVLALAWGVATLHVPTRVVWSDEGIRFHGYGRAHDFAWKDVTRVHVRRFIVRDRVLVRLAPARGWRGRYWLSRGLDGFDALVEELERRAADDLVRKPRDARGAARYRSGA